ncbi:glycosyltransferase [Methanoculleus horonobensis]|jgi:glycosyltransferase involved in cell wall biosynthesis|uniref:glycosyltransferase n=1 Tax=Methanoculleus horonobensis TaxID=528314 RepID=UPI00082C5711|nr:glycosyltransferase [Methanoculleus horonobensis]MDD3071325.1 glycosyltransferase [Methanoculleus horonobensis]MDD4253562.1 glycosyltransferase [Methanoculleus horonobensis]
MISVVVPTYNEEQNIERCLASLADQTVPRDTYEIIVVDGDSKDRTRELAEPLADRVFIQTSKRVGGARNDGAMAASGDIIATTDADCILPRDWVERIGKDFAEKDIVQLYGTVYPIEDSFRNRLSLLGANIFSRLGYYTRTIYFTLGCNTAFDREAFIRAGMYRCIDAGDDLEIAQRMRKLGKVRLDPRLKVGFSMRRYQQFGTLKSLWEWFYIVLRGGEAKGATYTQREYK